MFNVGDKIVYPMHGAGVIESIEEREILGRKQDYYIVRMPIGDMKVMIPTNNTEDIGIREIINGHELGREFHQQIEQGAPNARGRASQDDVFMVELHGNLVYFAKSLPVLSSDGYYCVSFGRAACAVWFFKLKDPVSYPDTLRGVLRKALSRYLARIS